jgi:hypothetical protein
MEASLSSDNQERAITLTGVIHDVKQLSSYDKLRLIRILAEELESSKNIFPLEEDRTYDLPTPYNSFGAAEILMNTLKSSDADRSALQFEAMQKMHTTIQK